MSVPPKADMCGALVDVRYGPKADISHCNHFTVRGLTFDTSERGRASLPAFGWMPMPFKEITKITLEAPEAIELDTGVFLPPGSYQGARMRTRDDLPGDVIWKPTRYRIELTTEQIASMGAKIQPNQSFEEIDVTKFVRRGRLIIR